MLIGRTGQGKSSLANVLINKNNNFEEVFKEGDYSVSETKDIQVEEFEHKGVKYRIVDTIGLDDTKLELRQVIRRIARCYKELENGLSQVFFVVGEKFTREEIEVYKILKEVLFDEEVAKYTTIVRTKFSNFEDEEERKKDINLIFEENNKLTVEMIKSCNGGKIIYVDNPSVNIKGSRGETENPINKRVREESRKILLSHLAERCKKELYKPEILDEISKKISNFAWREVEVLQRKLRVKKGELKKAERENNSQMIQSLREEINDINKQIEKRWELMEKTLYNAVIKVCKEVQQKCRIM